MVHVWSLFCELDISVFQLAVHPNVNTDETRRAQVLQLGVYFGNAPDANKYQQRCQFYDQDLVTALWWS